MAQKRIGVLVLCTGNSCRSQIFEAYLKHYGGDKFDVVSAGTEPAERIHPLTRVVLNEDGLDTGGMAPKDYRSFLGKISVYYLFIVCDGAAKSCPSVWPGVMERIIWPFEDPATFVGSEDEKLDRFRLVRDQIKDRVKSWVDSQVAESAVALDQA